MGGCTECTPGHSKTLVFSGGATCPNVPECTRMYPNVPECTPENPPNVPECTPANPPNVSKYTFANPPNIMKLQKMPPHQTSRSTFPPLKQRGEGFFLTFVGPGRVFPYHPTHRPSDRPAVRPTQRPTDRRSTVDHRPIVWPTNLPFGSVRPLDRPSERPTARLTDRPCDRTTERPTDR